VNSLRDAGYRIVSMDSGSYNDRTNLDGPLSFEVLCLPVERLDEAKKALRI
jgi:hypothetical protein